MSNLFEVAEENGVAGSSEDRKRGSVPGQCKVSRRIAVIGKVHSDAITIRDCTKIVQSGHFPPLLSPMRQLIRDRLERNCPLFPGKKTQVKLQYEASTH